MTQAGKNGNFIVNGSIVRWWQLLAENALDGNFSSSCSMSTTANSRE